MPEFPIVSASNALRSAGVVTGASSLATQLTASATVNVKGTWVELIAATEFDANWLLLNVTSFNNTASNGFLIDIGIGAATEQVIIPDLYAHNLRVDASYGPYLIPVFIPKGSRLTARCQSSAASITMRLSAQLIPGPPLGGGSGPSFVAAYGAVALSQGTNVDPGGTANTDSAWVEITPSTDRVHNWLVIAGKFGDGVLAGFTSWRMSVGIGAATEQVIVPDLHFSADPTTDSPLANVFCLPCFIPQGSRLTVRARCSIITDIDRDIYVKLYGCG